MRPESGPPALGAMPSRSPACARVIERVAARVEARVGEVSELLIDRVVSEMRLPPDDEDLREDLLAAARGSVGLITQMARSWTDPHVVPPPHDALVWARGLVARELSIDALLRVYRIGQSGYHEVWHDELVRSGAEPEVVLEALAAMSAFTFTWVDAISVPLVEAHEDERTRRLRGADAVRRETVQALLAGTDVDEQTAAARLGYRLDRPHLAVLAWLEPRVPWPDIDGLEVHLAAATTALARAGTTPLVLRESPRTAVAWITPDAGVADPASVARDALVGTPVRLALGSAASGVPGFRTTHDQARRARRVARLLRADAAVTAHGSVAVLDLLTQDVDAARALARSVLGPLADGSAASRRLLDTMEVFVAQHRSFARSAPVLGVHENTVAYRVRRALEIAGTPDEDTLWAAVQLAPLLDP